LGTLTGQVNGRHPAFAELALYAVASFENGVQTGDRVGSIHAQKMRLTRWIREQSETAPMSASARAETQATAAGSDPASPGRS